MRFLENFSVRTANSLSENGINSIEQLLEKTEIDLLKIKCFGKKRMYEIVLFLSNHGFKLKGSVSPLSYWSSVNKLTSRKRYTSRDVEILSDRLKTGLPYKTIAKKHKISTARVQQIINSWFRRCEYFANSVIY